MKFLLIKPIRHKGSNSLLIDQRDELSEQDDVTLALNHLHDFISYIFHL